MSAPEGKKPGEGEGERLGLLGPVKRREDGEASDEESGLRGALPTVPEGGPDALLGRLRVKARPTAKRAGPSRWLGRRRSVVLMTEGVPDAEKEKGEGEGEDEKLPVVEQLRVFGSYLRRYGRLLACGGACLLARTALDLQLGRLWAQGIDMVGRGEPMMVQATLTVLCEMSVGASEFGANVQLEFATAKVARLLRDDLLRHILSMEAGYFDARPSGSISSRLSSDVGELTNEITELVKRALGCGLTLVITSVYLFSLSWQLTLMSKMHIPLMVVGTYYYSKWMMAQQEKVQDAMSAANSVATELVGASRTVQAFGTLGHECERYGKKNAAHLAAVQHKLLRAEGWGAFSGRFMPSASLWITLVYGSMLVKSGRMNTATFITFLIFSWHLGECLKNLADVPSVLSKALGAGAKVFSTLKREPRRRPAGTLTIPPEELKGSFEIVDVHFSYPTRPEHPILRGASLFAEAGKITALVGKSGGGKSTCFGLLERFYEPTSGQVLLDGYDVARFNEDWLHTVVGIVTQDPVLFSGTIGENVSYSMRGGGAAMARVQAGGRVVVMPGTPQEPQGSASPTDVTPRYKLKRSPSFQADRTVEERVEEAARHANAHAFISKLPGGYGSEVGERGTQLSGGQKQRIAIARALLQDPRVLLLDEATSALDSEAEAAVQEALDRVMAGRTVAGVAHRLSTVAAAHKIYVFATGQICEQGTHDELVAQGGLYADLVRMQTNFAGQ